MKSVSCLVIKTVIFLLIAVIPAYTNSDAEKTNNTVDTIGIFIPHYLSFETSGGSFGGTSFVDAVGAFSNSSLIIFLIPMQEFLYCHLYKQQ